MILISAAGSGGTNELIKDFKHSFIGITNNIYKLFSSVIDQNYLVPSASDEENYINHINDIIKKHNITLFIPNSDIEALVASKNIDKIQTKVFLPSYKTIKTTFDKWKLYKTAKKSNIKMAKTIHIKSKKNIKQAFKKLHQPPLWCRIKSGSGSRHTSKVYSYKDAKNYINHTMLAYNIEMKEFLISEYLPGNDIAVMSIWKNGDIKLCKMAKRTQYFKNAGESPPSVIESFYDKSIEKFIIDAIKKLDTDANGLFNIDIKCFKDATPAITEINAGRFYYNMTLFNYGKINAFEIFLKLAFNEEIEFYTDDPKAIFIRDQDNTPVIISKDEFQKTKNLYEQKGIL